MVGGSGSSFSATGLVTQTLHAWPVKLETVVMLLLPTGVLALGSPVALIALPSLALRFISPRTPSTGARTGTTTPR